ncbi:MAG: radical SAM protein [Planctomycetota bacterium]|nr:radical SAM protein [Planctomycetota bacterium]
MLLLDYPKLVFEPAALVRREKTGRAAPKLIEISPVNRCNHRCVFCCFDWLKRTPMQLDAGLVAGTLRDASAIGRRAGLRSQAVFFSGEGEPLLHPDIVAMTCTAGKLGFACAVNTNGVRLAGDALGVIDASQYIRISMNGVDARDYARVHRARKEDFGLVLSNLAKSVRYRDKANPDCNLNVQFIYTGQPVAKFAGFIRRVAATGIDLLTVKGAYQHPLMRFRIGKLREGHDALVEAARAWTGRMQVSMRMPGFEWHGRAYAECFGPEWFVEIAADGDCYPCGPYVGVKKYAFGNINRAPFGKIWWSPAHRRILRECRRMAGPCQEMCRLDITNRYLYRLYNTRKEDGFL